MKKVVGIPLYFVTKKQRMLENDIKKRETKSSR